MQLALPLFGALVLLGGAEATAPPAPDVWSVFQGWSGRCAQSQPASLYAGRFSPATTTWALSEPAPVEFNSTYSAFPGGENYGSFIAADPQQRRAFYNLLIPNASSVDLNAGWMTLSEWNMYPAPGAAPAFVSACSLTYEQGNSSLPSRTLTYDRRVFAAGPYFVDIRTGTIMGITIPALPPGWAVARPWSDLPVCGISYISSTPSFWHASPTYGVEECGVGDPRLVMFGGVGGVGIHAYDPRSGALVWAISNMSCGCACPWTAASIRLCGNQLMFTGVIGRSNAPCFSWVGDANGNGSVFASLGPTVSDAISFPPDLNSGEQFRPVSPGTGGGAWPMAFAQVVASPVRRQDYPPFWQCNENDGAAYAAYSAVFASPQSFSHNATPISRCPLTPGVPASCLGAAYYSYIP